MSYKQTYHIKLLVSQGIRVDKMPVFVLFSQVIFTIKYELFFVKIKHKDNNNNTRHEGDLFKLRKERQLVLNKLVVYGVDSSKIDDRLVKSDIHLLVMLV